MTENKKKDILYNLLKCLTSLYICFIKILHRGSSFRVNGVVHMRKLKISGDLEFSLNSGYIVKSHICVQGRNNKIILDNNVKMNGCKIIITGDNCTLLLKGSRHMENTIFEILDSNCNITVDYNTGFNKNRILVAGLNNNINIGADCIFAENAEVWASDTHSILNIESNLRMNLDKPIFIGNRVWVGNRALIHKGVVIEDDCIIAAGSIVVKNVDRNTLVGGVPASPIKKNIKWTIKRL